MEHFTIFNGENLWKTIIYSGKTMGNHHVYGEHLWNISPFLMGELVY